MTRTFSYEQVRDAAMQRASWWIIHEQKRSGREVDRPDVIQDLWVWLLAKGRDGKTGDERMRILLEGEPCKFRRAVKEMAAVGRRAWTHYEKETPEGVQSLGKDNEPVSIFGSEDSVRLGWTSTPSYWPSPIERRVAALGPPDCDILQMSAEGFNATDIGEVLELPPATVRQRRKRALDRLRGEMAEAA